MFILTSILCAGNVVRNAGETRKEGDKDDDDVVDWGDSGDAGGVGDGPARGPENFSTLNFKCTQSLPILVIVDFSTVLIFLLLTSSSTVKSSAEMTKKIQNISLNLCS